MGSSISNIDFLDPPSAEGELGMLGHYRVIDQLGKGGMGFVFRAEDSKLQRTVALKVMNRKIAATPNSRARFISEARAMAAVHHDNVATIFEVGEHNQTPYMAMEMLKGSTFEKFKGVKERPGYETIIQYAKEMARGLAAAHAQGIVHRDIKPANMWIEEGSQRIKILDFGLALASTPVDQLAGRGSVIGTPGYLSPEQARSEPLDDRSDLYSVGVVLYELATGKLPLHNKSVAGQLIAILSKPPKPLRELNPDIPQPLADLIHKLLRKEPRHRVSSAVELEKELNRVAVECDSKSEVAQALNKLQAGLNQIVSQKDEPDFSEALAMPEMPDPFATLPANLPEAPMATAASKAAASTSGIGSAAAAPYSKRKPKPKSKQAAKPEASALKKYWPIIAAAVAIIVIGIPLAAFMTATGPHEGSEIDLPTPNTVGPAASSLASNKPKPQEPPANQNSSSNQPTPKPANRNKSGPPAAEVTEITEVMVPGAVSLINSMKGNGSFENLNSQGEPLTGSGQEKKTFPGWSATFKGNSAGLSSQDARGSSDGKFYGFAQQKSTLDLSSNTVDYTTQDGDVFRLALDIGSEDGDGDWKGKTKYNVVLGFRGEQRAISKWTLADLEDQTDINAGKRTIGYQYIAQPADIGKKPFVKITMTEGAGRRPISYLDNVRLSVQGPNSSLAANSNTPNLAEVAVTPGPEMAMTEEPNDPPPVSKIAETPMVAGVTDPTVPDPTASDPESTSTTAMQKVYIRTSDGRGADAAVKKGGSSRDTLGDKSFIAVQQRGDVPIQHSYLKFDLEPITPTKEGNNKNKQIKRNTGRVALILKSSGKKEPGGGQVMVYGASDTAAQVWAETGSQAIYWKNSYSEQGLESLPLLAELTIPADQPIDSVITITSPELADFIRNSPGSLTTLVLSGRSNNNMPLAFVSNDGSKEESPTLIVEVAP